MFSTTALFQGTICPERDQCWRPQCIFSHRTDLPPPTKLNIPVTQPVAGPSTVSNQAPRRVQSEASTIPAKRASSSIRQVSEPYARSSGEPPRKILKTGTAERPVAVATASATPSSGPPVLKINAALSKVAVPVRQAMLKNLYDHFLVLYHPILSTNPEIASEHALKQEEEVHKKANKQTYRHAVIQCIAAIKRRPPPDSVNHPSVGTESELAARVASVKAISSLKLTRENLSELILSESDMKRWGYITAIPAGVGGSQPVKEGVLAQCDRCAKPYIVKANPTEEECFYHYGKAFGRKVNGEHLRVFGCCGKPSTAADGCVHGPHVFYEKNPEDLHLRHPFSCLDSPSTDSALDVVALDCEMIYTTQGFTLARVSVVDGSGATVFDEFVRMSDGVQVIDYNTRFSGITEQNLSQALLPLASIRKSLDSLINSNTILVGHAIDNDLKALRIVHDKCVDTAVLFPHQAGPPYRRALRDLARQHLNVQIQQGGGNVGHSSLEDAVATLDLVRWYIVNNPQNNQKKI